MNEVKRVLLSRKTLIFFAIALMHNCVFLHTSAVTKRLLLCREKS